MLPVGAALPVAALPAIVIVPLVDVTAPLKVSRLPEVDEAGPPAVSKILPPELMLPSTVSDPLEFSATVPVPAEMAFEIFSSDADVPASVRLTLPLAVAMPS